jgi:2-(3-amino-3-carboxypropyl)histidine synthase
MAEGMASAIEKLKQLKAKRVFVQYPEGLKLRVQEIAKDLEKAGFEILVCVEPCYGACDIRDTEAERLGCDALLHIGHEDFGVKVDVPVVFWEYFIDADPVPIIEKEFAKLEAYNKIGIVTSIQFVGAIEKAKKFLESRGKKVFAHKALQHEGQILGCNLDAALKIEKDVDCFLCISAGKFYSLGLVMKTDKPMLCLDLEKGAISDMDETKRKIQKTIAWNRAALDEAKRVALLVSWKRGQVKQPFEIKRKLEAEGKEVLILAMDEITPEKLVGLKIDAAINMACPRIGIDDLGRYKVPVLNLEDAGICTGDCHRS